MIEKLGQPTVLALTATATPSVREDILHQLGIEHVKPIVRGFDRPNLVYEARKADKEADKLKILTALFTGDDALEGTGIIYTATIKNALEVQHYLTHELGHPGRRLSLEAAQRRPHLGAQPLHGRSDSRRRRDQRVRAGHRQAEHPLRRALRSARVRSKPTRRKPDAPGATACRRAAFSIYRMSDTRVQNYFLTGKYPDVEEVQRVFGTIEVFGDQAGGVSMTDLRKILQLPLTKLQSDPRAAQEIGLHRDASASRPTA